VSIRVAVVDDQALVRSGFCMVLDHQPDIEVVAEAGTGLEAVDVARRLRPDVVLMDIRMPELDGLQATARIVDELGGAVRVLILTTFEPDEYVYRALRAGASGFVLKDIPPEQLITAVRTVAEGGALLAPSITRRLIGQFAAQRTVAPAAATRLAQLTDRERDVVVAVARGASNAEIAGELFIGPATVKSHVSSVLTKLGLRDRAQVVVFAYESGLVTAGDGRSVPPT
jgi:DNA-binding NarL/FixJ family response regulator